MRRKPSTRFLPEVVLLEARLVLDAAPVPAGELHAMVGAEWRQWPRARPGGTAPEIATQIVLPTARLRALRPSTILPDRLLQLHLASRLDRIGQLRLGGEALVRPQWAQTRGQVAPRYFGHNTVWSRGGLGLWDERAHAPDPQALALVAALRPGVLRFPGGTRAMLYHFDEAIGPVETRTPQCDPFIGQRDDTSYGLDEFLRLAQALGSEVTLVSPWIEGTPQEAAALVAYVNAELGSSVPIGVDVNGKDWGTAGDWAARRAANGRPVPYDVEFLEIGNEPYLDFPIGPPGTCGHPGVLTQAQRFVRGVPIPTTAADYAGQVAETAALVHAIDPTIQIGATALTTILGRSDARTAVSDVDRRLGTADPWNPRLVRDAGDAFDFFVVHAYNVGLPPGSLDLAEDLRLTIRELRSLDPTKRIAVTEFGSVLLGDSLQNALVTADVIRVSVEEQTLMTLRHILIEDDPSGPFAQLAAILGPQRRRTPGYFTELLASNLLRGQTAVPTRVADRGLRVLSTRDALGQRLGLMAFDERPLALGPRRVRIALPPGAWSGTVFTLAGPSLISGQVALNSAPIGGVGALRLSLPPNGLAFVHLARAPTA